MLVTSNIFSFLTIHFKFWEFIVLYVLWFVVYCGDTNDLLIICLYTLYVPELFTNCGESPHDCVTAYKS